MIPLRFSGFTIFQPTRPLRGATGGQGGILSLSPYFNPRAPCGARPWAPWNLLSLSAEFQPTRPLRGATVKLWPWIVRRNISTHAPLAGRDQQLTHPGNHLGEISTHAPLAGRDGGAMVARHALNVFQPTRPLRGATIFGRTTLRLIIFQPTRPLRGATDKENWETIARTISTHAPLAGRD